MRTIQTFVSSLLVLIQLGCIHQNPAQRADPPLPIGSITTSPDSRPLVRYFYHSGWMIETNKHLLVFDFIAYPAEGIDYSLLKKELTRKELSGKKIYVFISHDHDDHFKKEIFDIQNDIKDVTFILGWKYPPQVKHSFALNPGDSLYTEDIKVNTHIATDDGSAFLVRVDGYTFYHGGDHALWAASLEQLFTTEIQKIKQYATSVDLAFLPAAKGMAADCTPTPEILKGIEISARILKPKVIALQHIGCPAKIGQYKTIQKELGNLSDHWILASKYNETFVLPK